MDGIDTSSPDAPFFLTATTAQNVKRNLVDSLRSHRRQSSSIAAWRVVVATSQPATGSLHEDLRKAADDEGFQLVNLHGQRAFADLLYGSPKWTRDLLGLSGAPSALSAVPLSSRLQSDLPLVGRDADVQWLVESSGDVVISGHPASGKTHLLRQFVDRGWLFVVDPDRGRIANDIRELTPEVVVLDDAHGDLDLLRSVRQIRADIHAEFRISAVTWPGDKEGVLQALGVSGDSVLDLQLLSRDEVLEIVKAAGIGGPVDLQRTIVNQSGGRPGLTATLCDLASRGDYGSLFSGASLLNKIRTLIDDEADTILAVAALTDDGGVSLEDIRSILELDMGKVRRILTGLGHTGVIRAGSLTGKATIWPFQLRYAIVGDAFFSSETYRNLPLDPVMERLDERSIVGSLVGAILMGAQIPKNTIEPILCRSGLAKDFAQYSRLGERQAQFALAAHPEGLKEIAPYSLETNPAETLSLSLRQAAEDDQIRDSDDGLLGIVKRWIESAPHYENLQLERRKLLTTAAMRYLADNGDPQTALRALCLAMSPRFDSATSDPGSGLSLTITSGLASRTCLDGLVQLWPAVLDAIPAQGPQNWSSLFEMLHNWAFYAILPESPPERIGEFMRSHASAMAADLADKFSEHPGILIRIRELSHRADLGVAVRIPDLFATLYPIHQSSDDFEKESARRSEAARRLAADLEPRGPDYVLPLILNANCNAAETGRTLPDETLTVTQAIAARAADPYAWAERAVDLGLTWMLVEPLLRESRLKDREGALPLTLRALTLETVQFAAMSVVLTADDPLEEEMEATLDLAPQFRGGLATLVARGQIPKRTVRQLLAHLSPDVAETTAVHLWKPNRSPRVSDDLVEDWRAAMLRAPGVDLFISDIFEHETDLFAEWLISLLRSDALQNAYALEHTLSDAFNNLSADQRIDALSVIETTDACFFAAWIVSELVGDDPSLFQQLLAMDHPGAVHEAGFGSVSEAKIRVACAVGWTPERIARVIMWPGVPIVESGPYSDNLKTKLGYFEGLAESEDSEIAAVGRAGCDISSSLIDQELERERDEEVYGL